MQVQFHRPEKPLEKIRETDNEANSIEANT